MKELLPPYSTCKMCRNSMGEMCIERCVPAKDYSWFELKEINFQDLPPFPIEEFSNGMPAKVRGLVVAAYLKKIVDFLQGVEDERVTYSERCRRISNHLPVTALLTYSAEEDPARQALRKAYRDKAERPARVVGEEDGT